MSTCYVLQHAANCLHESEAKVYMDSGVENLNREVDKLLEAGTLERVVAQIDVTFSNSLIESWWRSLKHGWLFINHLENIVTLRKLIDFYAAEHNQRMPHSAFHGQTPDSPGRRLWVRVEGYGYWTVTGTRLVVVELFPSCP
jgi:putative transposase